MQPLGQALRTRLGDAVEVDVDNEPDPYERSEVEYANGSKSYAKMRQPKSSFGPLAREDFSAIWQWGKSGRFIFPIAQGGGTPTQSPASIDAVADESAKPRVCGMRNCQSRLGGQLAEGNLAPMNATGRLGDGGSQVVASAPRRIRELFSRSANLLRIEFSA